MDNNYKHKYIKLPAEYLPESEFEYTFEDWWSEVEAFAEQNRISTNYVEEEFCLDGELIPVHLKWQEDD